jgi:hypothetical protein
MLSEPLASFATFRLIVLPVQILRGGDPMGWSVQAGEPRPYLAALDQALETAFRERGLQSTWTLPSDLVRTARRNPTYATDPAQIRAGDAVRRMERQQDARIPEPVASQIRTLAGFHDARYALVPVELRFEPSTSGDGGRAVLHLAVLDVRGSMITWLGDVATEMARDFSPGLSASLAKRFADLVAAR